MQLEACGVRLPKLTIPAGAMAIFPVNIDGIRYATAQLVAQRDGKIYLMQIPGIPTTICLQNGKTLKHVKAKGADTPVAHNIYLLSQFEAEHLFLEERVHTDKLYLATCEKMREAGSLREITIGAQKVAEAPTEADWQQAAVYRIALPFMQDEHLPSDLLLSIDYQGDCARLYADGKLIADHFQYGRPFLYGLWRLPKECSTLELRILPHQSGAPIYLPREADPTPGENVKSVKVSPL